VVKGAAASAVRRGGEAVHLQLEDGSPVGRTCRQLIVTLDHGTAHRANFNFVK
jgi:hypothetical protein